MAQTKKQPSAAERDRREKQRQAATSKVIFGEVPEVVLPGIGKQRLRLRNPDLALIERRLTPVMDELPDALSGEWQKDGRTVPPGTDGAAWSPYVNVWDALEVLSERYPMDTISVLLFAALRHAGVTDEQVDDLPPAIFRDPNLTEALGQAVAVAFGAGVEDDEARPTEAGASPAE